MKKKKLRKKLVEAIAYGKELKKLIKDEESMEFYQTDAAIQAFEVVLECLDD